MQTQREKEDVMLLRTAVIAVLLAVATSGCKHLNNDAEQPPPAKKEQVQENKPAAPAAAATEEKPATAPDPDTKGEVAPEEGNKATTDQPASEEKTEEGGKTATSADEPK
jgi:hypothetical protein